jgi:ATP/ADP translocase
MIIWSGLGFLVAAIAFLLLLIAEYVTESLFGDEFYYQAHGWPKLLAFFLAGMVIWPLGKYLNSKQGKIMIEKETGKEVLIKPKHSLFFIPMEYWGPILLALGIIFLFV